MNTTQIDVLLLRRWGCIGWRVGTKGQRLLSVVRRIWFFNGLSPKFAKCCFLMALGAFLGPHEASAGSAPMSRRERLVEWTIESHKRYADPFNDVDVDVIFSRDGQIWREPTFWRGGQRWTVRFAPPTPGEYTYRLESTDRANPDLNGHEGRVTIAAYRGPNELLRRGMIRVSTNHRYFEQADGTPFYWLGDTWWMGLSSRLSWEGFKTLTADRKAKGFTVVQMVAGLAPFEERAPSDPGCCNEGGCVWTPGFERINPQYFDFADRRIEHLLDSGMVPAIVGGWWDKLPIMGVEKMKKHWRYIIARYGAYPVFWIVGGEVFDPPEPVARRYASDWLTPPEGGWTAVARYLRATDPYHHPVTVHSGPLDDILLQDESLMDFDLPQPGHGNWLSMPAEISYLNSHYARTGATKPIVIGEIDYERLTEANLEDVQRVAFWLGMLNGAAGYTYGANGVWESYTADKPFHRIKSSLMTWQEGMKLPGSYQIGLGAKLLQQYAWPSFVPHPEWVAPRGTTLLEPRDGNPFHVDIQGVFGAEGGFPESEWQKREGNFHLPYAAGIPGEVRIIYLPIVSDFVASGRPPTVLGLEPRVRYHAYFWDPSIGVKFDLGAVERPALGTLIAQDDFNHTRSVWTTDGARIEKGEGGLSNNGETVAVLHGVNETDAMASVEAQPTADVGLVLRFHGEGDYIAAVYSAQEKVIYVLDRAKGTDGKRLGSVPVPKLDSAIKLSAEVRGRWAAASITDGTQTYTSEIVAVSNTTAGGAGLIDTAASPAQVFGHFELRRSPALVADEHLERKLYDARGQYRGEISGGSSPVMDQIGYPTWDDFGKHKIILLDAYRPETLPYNRDWVLVLDATQNGRPRS